MLVLAAVAWKLGDTRIAPCGGAASLGIFVAAHSGEWTPGGRFGLANAVTALRIVLIVVFASLPSLGPAASLTLAAFLCLDGVDGFIARRPPVTASKFGAQFDMETDAL